MCCATSKIPKIPKVVLIINLPVLTLAWLPPEVTPLTESSSSSSSDVLASELSSLALSSDSVAYVFLTGGCVFVGSIFL